MGHIACRRRPRPFPILVYLGARRIRVSEQQPGVIDVVLAHASEVVEPFGPVGRDRGERRDSPNKIGEQSRAGQHMGTAARPAHIASLSVSSAFVDEHDAASGIAGILGGEGPAIRCANGPLHACPQGFSGDSRGLCPDVLVVLWVSSRTVDGRLERGGRARIPAPGTGRIGAKMIREPVISAGVSQLVVGQTGVAKFPRYHHSRKGVSTLVP
jgi:hypothetical protein